MPALSGASQQCNAPCVDLRQHPILHSSACVCAEGALSGMRGDADKAIRHAERALLGEPLTPLLCFPRAAQSLTSSSDMTLSKGTPSVLLPRYILQLREHEQYCYSPEVSMLEAVSTAESDMSMHNLMVS